MITLVHIKRTQRRNPCAAMKQFCILLGIVAVISASGRRAFKRGAPVPVPDCIGKETEIDSSAPVSELTSMCEVDYEVIQSRVKEADEEDDAYLIRICTPESPGYMKLTDKGGLEVGGAKGSSTVFLQCGVPEDYDTYTKNGCYKRCTYRGAEAHAKLGAEAHAKLRRHNEVKHLKGMKKVTSLMKKFGG